MKPFPELLAPAGNLEKLILACDYGADAVYFSGQEFGLRAASDNFSQEELAEGVLYAHSKQCHAYITLNGFLHDEDLEALPDHLDYLKELGVDAVIVSDLGVAQSILNWGESLPIHLSTQASCLNSESALFWKDVGVKRLILGRESSIQAAAQIKNVSGLEVEMFIHGSMCMAYSGHCVISNYTRGRDSNRGGCAHSCRFEYSFDDGSLEHKTFLSSKDLNGIALIKQYADAGIDSIKIEGRMKGHLYVATVSKAYREGLDECRSNGSLSSESLERLTGELQKFSHRDYTTASLLAPASRDSIYSERESGLLYDFLGRVVSQVGEFTVVEVRKKFKTGQLVELLRAQDPITQDLILEIQTLDNETLEQTKPSSLVKIKFNHDLHPGDLIRGETP